MSTINRLREQDSLRKFREYKLLLGKRIEDGRRANDEYTSTIKRHVEVSKAVSTVSKAKQNQMVLLEKARTEDAEFKNRRIEYMSDVITDFVGELFPNDGYVAKVICDTKRGFTAHLQLTDKNGNIRLIHMSEGKFNQSLISFGSSVSISLKLGANKLYTDECFSVSDTSNIVKVSEFYDRLREDGVQIFMIEQKPEGYKNLRRREIRLTRDDVDNVVLRPEIVDI